ncbi:MAG: flavin-containing monooxygenase [Carbonactinosporaceae bacterium]
MSDDSAFQVAIIGTGFSGLCMAIQLKRAGIEDFVVLEKADDIGGTWRENRYPGCACDVHSVLYSFSFAPNPSWSRKFAPQQEIWDYLRHCVEAYRIGPHIRFSSEVVAADFDEPAGSWRITTSRGETVRATAVVAGLGPLHEPSYPDIPGLDRFTGESLHSAHWERGYDLSGKRVAVVGTGASAVQFIPEIAPAVSKMYVFQRTPPWVVPKPDRAFTRFERQLFHRVPAVLRAYRAAVYWLLEGRVPAFSHPAMMRGAERLVRRSISRQIPDRALREAVAPDYTLGCKRVLLSNDYYGALTRPNVELVTADVTAADAGGLLTRDGVHREVDAIIYGTGFRVGDRVARMPIRGRGGLDIRDAWHDGMTAYLGTSVAGFPNLFLVLGPNTGLGHSSMVFMIEAQVDYIMRCLRTLTAKRVRYLDVREAAQSSFNRRLQRRLDGTVWSSGCRSWYLDADGVNRTLWPGSTWRFWLRTRRLNLAHYDTSDPAEDRPPLTAGSRSTG